MMIANLTFTYGGLKTNLDSQVVSTHGAPIPGLFSAGELTGLFYHEVWTLMSFSILPCQFCVVC